MSGNTDKDSDPIEFRETGIKYVFRSKRDTGEYLSVDGFSKVLGLPLTEEQLIEAKRSGLLPDLYIKTSTKGGKPMVRSDFLASDIEMVRAYVMKKLGMKEPARDCVYMTPDKFDEAFGEGAAASVAFMPRDRFDELLGGSGLKLYTNIADATDSIFHYELGSEGEIREIVDRILGDTDE